MRQQSDVIVPRLLSVASWSRQIQFLSVLYVLSYRSRVRNPVSRGGGGLMVYVTRQPALVKIERNTQRHAKGQRRLRVDCRALSARTRDFVLRVDANGI